MPTAMIQLPSVFRIRQSFARPQVGDIAATVREEIARRNLLAAVQPGQRVAITAGSRGIAQIATILSAIVDAVLDADARPTIVAAMGSHGGATTEGQLQLLGELGITPSRCGCPIEASMETEILFDCSLGFPVHFSRDALHADHLLVCGRVKPHTSFTGPYGSGLLKMLAVGLGKQAGAKQVHAASRQHDFATILQAVVPQMLSRCRVLGGVAIVENAYDEVAHLEAVAADDLLRREPDLLRMAAEWMPHLPFDDIDLLLVDEIGKNISGTGLDMNIVGRVEKCVEKGVRDHLPERPGGCFAQMVPDPFFPRRIIARSLTPQSHGNALGVGYCDFCTERLAQAIDREVMQVNALTSGNLAAIEVPPILPSDREALQAALLALKDETSDLLSATPEAKLVWIRNTLDLTEVACSTAYWQESHHRDDLQILTDPKPLPCNKSGDLPMLHQWV